MLAALCLALVGSASAFAPTVHPRYTKAAVPVVSMSEAGMSRRAALASTAFAATAVSLAPLAAIADANEDAVAAIAAKNKRKLEEAKAAERAKIAVSMNKAEKENEGADVLVKGVAAGSFFFSLPFFYKNLARLGLRWSSVVRKDIDPSKYDKGR